MSSHHSRRFVVLRIALQVFFALCLVVVINAFSFHHYSHRDCSRSHRFSLSDQGSVLFAGIKQPAHIIIYFSPTSLTEEATLYDDVKALMQEYQIKGRENLIIEYLDPARQLGRAREVQGKYKFNANENVIVIDYLNHSAVIPIKELGEYDNVKTANGEPPRLIAFRGEQVINAALIGLSGVPLKKVYCLQGHGEPIPGTPPLTIIGRYLERQNITSALLNLSNETDVPADAALLVIDGARVDLSQAEIEALKNYWKHSGRFFILLDPTANTPLLQQMLIETGISPCPDRVIRTSENNPMAVTYDVIGDFIPGSELTKQFLKLNILLPGTTQSLALQTSDEEIQRRPLIQAAPAFSKATDFADTESNAVPPTKLSDPIVIAAMADHGALHDDRVAVNASRMVVVGNCDFINDKSIGEVDLDFFSSVLNGLIDRVQLTGNTAKMKAYFTLNLSEEEMKRVALWCIVIIPGLAALLGFICIWRRRR